MTEHDEYFTLLGKAANARRLMEEVTSPESRGALTQYAAKCEQEAKALLERKLRALAADSDGMRADERGKIRDSR